MAPLEAPWNPVAFVLNSKGWVLGVPDDLPKSIRACRPEGSISNARFSTCNVMSELTSAGDDWAMVPGGWCQAVTRHSCSSGGRELRGKNDHSQLNFRHRWTHLPELIGGGSCGKRITFSLSCGKGGSIPALQEIFRFAADNGIAIAGEDGEAVIVDE
ncbi:hypothetical protein [Brachybacterium phenoliresistens]|uniref:hypothetical protein n=1 Tax=Brachybacterium phenoliresistens TaxID=396014 RepID=UPI0031DA9CC1